MDSKKKNRFMMAFLVLDGFALASQAERSHRSGWNPAGAVALAALGAGALWAASNIEGEFNSTRDWVDFYRKQAEKGSSK